MVLEISGGLFGQNDVRETPASSSSANAFIFNTTDFLDDAGNVSLKNKTSYWSCPGQNFKAVNPDTDTIHYGTTAPSAVSDATGVTFVAPVFIPHNAIITSVKVFGNQAGSADDETWTLKRFQLSGAEGTMATANLNTADTTISNATINNSTHVYYLITSSLDSTDQINGAIIAYTTDYD